MSPLGEIVISGSERSKVPITIKWNEFGDEIIVLRGGQSISFPYHEGRRILRVLQLILERG